MPESTTKHSDLDLKELLIAVNEGVRETCEGEKIRKARDQFGNNVAQYVDATFPVLMQAAAAVLANRGYGDGSTDDLIRFMHEVNEESSNDPSDSLEDLLKVLRRQLFPPNAMELPPFEEPVEH